MTYLDRDEHERALEFAIQEFFRFGQGPSHADINTIDKRYDLNILKESELTKHKRVISTFEEINNEQFLDLCKEYIYKFEQYKLTNDPENENVKALKKACRPFNIHISDEGKVSFNKPGDNVSGLNELKDIAALNRDIIDLEDAIKTGNSRTILSRTKNLIECVAKWVCQEQNVPYSTSEKFPSLINKALSATELDTASIKSRNLSEPHERLLLQISTISKWVDEFRNLEGDGHGSPVGVGDFDHPNSELRYVARLAIAISHLMIDNKPAHFQTATHRK